MHSELNLHPSALPTNPGSVAGPGSRAARTFSPLCPGDLSFASSIYSILRFTPDQDSGTARRCHTASAQKDFKGAPHSRVAGLREDAGRIIELLRPPFLPTPPRYTIPNSIDS